MVIKRMSAPVQRGGGVCSARIRQVANTARVVHTAHALPTAAVTTAPVRLDGVAQIVIMTHAMADLVVNMEHVLSRRKVATNVHAPTDMTAMLVSTRNGNVAAPAATATTTTATVVAPAAVALAQLPTLPAAAAFPVAAATTTAAISATVRAST
jgi:hypothetical protein